MVDWIGIAVAREHLDQAAPMVEQCPVTLRIIEGGDTRAQSIARVLKDVPPEIDLIAVHDAARPFWPVSRWDELISRAHASGGAILALPVYDTIKRATGSGIETVDRSDLWAAQTPQVFRADVLLDAYAHAAKEGIDATDDADLVRRIGGVVEIVNSTARNFKITTRTDWEHAEALMAYNDPQSRVGHGYDVHRLGSDDPLMIGGVKLAESGGLIGHSDGDVLLHAICDALLGAAALGDIGQHFPPTDPKFKGIDSRELVRATAQILRDHDFIPAQIDATVAAEAPKLAPHIPQMRELIAGDLGIDTESVSVKATTTEGLGFVGRREGIAAYAVALVSRVARSDD